MSRGNIVWCDWCGDIMVPFDVVRTGMGRGKQLVYRCIGQRGDHPCAHESERYPELAFETVLVTMIWRIRLLRMLLDKAGRDARRLNYWI